ncbi:MAG: DUF3416 domain-containing protein, partial [Dehalococcoidia bacterium]|nr:DUF3416 domain-containing protein [Dehalococcoidia bacterium]
MRDGDGPRRVVIEGVRPEIDGGRFPIKRAVGEKVVVEADVLADGYDALSCVLLYRKEGALKWLEVPMEPLASDRWRGEFIVTELGRYCYTLQAWADPFQSWQRDLKKRVEAEQEVSGELSVGAELVLDASSRASGDVRKRLQSTATALGGRGNMASKLRLALDEGLASLVSRCSDRRSAATYHRELTVVVDRERTRFSTWYEMFPHSCAPKPGRHGTFKDCEERLSYVAAMDFDVLYLPPIHPVGRTHRKGKNNSPTAGPQDPGSPWAIGSKEGGHKAVNPLLGTLADFRRLVEKAREHSIEIAL